jgi:hypothetical protein
MRSIEADYLVVGAGPTGTGPPTPQDAPLAEWLRTVNDKLDVLLNAAGAPC